MKQILQNLGSGETSLSSVPAPKNINGHILIETSKSLVSAGTERMLVDFGKSNLLDKARAQPDKVKEVLVKIKTEGLPATYGAVKTKLDQPIPLGYCNVGRVVNSGNSGLSKGARVVSNGYHAEIVRVPKNLVVPIPDEVDDDLAAFAILGAVAMQGVRLANPTVGETIVVTGLGLIGLLTVQILKANGCRVLGIDFDSDKCELARQFGADVVDLSKKQDPLLFADALSRGRGVDAVLITASSRSNDIVHQAATMCRKRGRIVLIGVVGLELSRADFYEKELSFQVSCSYGPGRYDEQYEEMGHDYPFGFIRWTEQRNIEAVLDLMTTGQIDARPLISHRFKFEDAVMAYEKLGDNSARGILLEYQSSNYKALKQNTISLTDKVVGETRSGNIAFIGGGNYASRFLIPAFSKAGGNLKVLVTSGGVSASHHGRKNGFLAATTDIEEALEHEIDTVVIATRHNLHASHILMSLDKGHHVFVEKPLALTHQEIDEIEASQKTNNRIVMVGFNRRFSPHIQKMHSLLKSKPAPKTFIMTMNAGAIPKNHWTQDSEVGGGRIIGEACHYIDLMRFLAGSKIRSFTAMKMGDSAFVEVTEDKVLISLSFEDGSIGSIQYFSNGDHTFPKERIEVFCDGSVLQLDNFRKLRGFGWKGFNKMNLWRQDKGQKDCVDEFLQSVRRGKASPIPRDEVFEVARVSVDIAESLRG